MTKLFQLVSGGNATEFLKSSGSPGLILSGSPGLYDRADVCQLVEEIIDHHIVMLPLGSDLELPKGVFEVAYGDCLRPTKNTVFLACDIMDYDFWHYHETCRRYGRFCFSVNTDLCDRDVYIKTIEFLKNDGKFSDYWGMLEP